MANTKSAQKMVRKIAKRTDRNKMRVSRVRSFLRRVEEALESGNKEDAASALKSVQPELMRAAQKGVYHRKTASRKVSRLAKRVNSLS
jgi:small subunit ribosomal protein S20